MRGLLFPLSCACCFICAFLSTPTETDWISTWTWQHPYPMRHISFLWWRANCGASTMRLPTKQREPNFCQISECVPYDLEGSFLINLPFPLFSVYLNTWQLWRCYLHCASPCCSWYSSWPQVSPSVDIESSIKQHIERQRTRLIACKLSDSFFCFFLSFVCSLWEEGGVRRVAERHIPYAASVQQQDMQRALHRRGRHQGKMRLAHR